MAQRNKRPQTVITGKENSSLQAQFQNQEITHGQDDLRETKKQSANLKKNLKEFFHQRVVEDPANLPSSFRGRSKAEHKVFEYHQDASAKPLNQSTQNIDGVKKVKDFLMDQEVANFHSLQNGPARTKSGNQTSLEVRQYNDDIHNIIIAQELNTINYSNQGSYQQPVGRQKSKSRPDTQLTQKLFSKVNAPEQVKHEHAVFGKDQHRKKSQRCKEIVGRKVGAPQIVTSQLNNDDMTGQERAIALDLIAANIVRENSFGRKKTSISPSVRPEKKKKSQNNKQKRVDQSKPVLSKSQDQMKQLQSQKCANMKKLQPKSKHKQVSLMDYLDANLEQQPPLQTLNILTATADQFIQKTKANRDKSKSVVTSNAIKIEQTNERKRSNEKERSLIQTKYLNFQRDASSKKRTNSNSLDRKKMKLQQKGQLVFKQDSSNSRSRSKDNQSKEASRGSKDALQRESRKKSLKAKNLLQAVNQPKSKQSSSETVNINLRNLAFSNKKKSLDAEGSLTSCNRKNLKPTQSLSPKTKTEQVNHRQLNKSQNLLHHNLVSQNQFQNMNQNGVAKSAPGLKYLQNPGSIETVAITESLLDKEFILQSGEDSQTIFRNGLSAFDIERMKVRRLSQQEDRQLIENPHQTIKSNYQLTLKATKGSQSPHRQTAERSMQSLAKSGTSKIDKLIKENLKKQIQKDVELKEKERQVKNNSKKKRVELEQANERVRKLNKEKVQRRQMMMLLQSNLASQQMGLANTAGPNDKSLDRNLQNMLARSDKDEITNEMTKLLQAIDERPQPQKRNPLSKKKPQQLQTQKFEVQNKLADVDQLESMLEQQSYLASDGLQNNQDSIVVQSNADSQNFGNALLGLKKKGKDAKVYFEPKQDHRRSHGLDFLDIRKEILSELKQLGPKIKHKKRDKQLKAQMLDEPKPVYIQLRGSISQRQLLEGQKGSKICIKKPLIAQKKVDSIFSAINKEHHRQDLSQVDVNNASTFNEENTKKQFSLDISKLVERANIQQQQQNNQTAPLKKEMIRKFMKQKAKKQNEKVEKQKQQEIKKTLKVHGNLLRLHNFCKKQLLNTTTTQPQMIQLSHKMPNTVMNKSNLKVKGRNNQADRPKRSDLDDVTGNDLNVTPNRMYFEDSEPSLNVSGTRLSRGGTNQQNRKDLSKSRAVDVTDDLYEDSKIQSMQTLEERPINSLGQHQRNVAKRQNKFSSGLAPCFEKSSSAKTLRAQFNKKSNSPKRPSKEPVRDPVKEVPTANQSLISTKIKMFQAKQDKPRVERADKQKKVKLNKKQRGKSITKGSGGSAVYMASTSKIGAQNRLRVNIPNIPNLRTKRRDSSANRRGSSVGTLESKDESFDRTSRRRHSSLKKKQRQVQAAKMIQREVRGYLKRVGFYEAREILSPDRQPQINLFIEEKKFFKATRVQSKGSKKSKSSKSRSGSRSSGGKKKQSKGKRHIANKTSSPNKPISGRISRKTSPDQKEPWRRSVLQHRQSKLQETTIIAELSGYKKRNLLHDDGSDSEQESRSRQEIETHLINLNSKHQRLESMQILNSENYNSAKTPFKNSSQIQSSPEIDGQSDRLNQVQVLPQFSRMTFLEADDESELDQATAHKIIVSPEKQKQSPQKQQTKSKSQKPFIYQPKDVLQSASVSILDRLQGNTASNNFNKDDQTNALIPPSKLRQLPQLQEQSKDDSNSTSWLAENIQNMKSVQTPRSSQQIMNLEQRSHQSLSQVLKSASVSDNDVKRNQMSVESKRSSQGLGYNEAISQSSGSVFDRNAFQQFTNNQKNTYVQNSEYQKQIQYREDCLKLREHKEKKHIQKLLKNNQCSPRTYHAKKETIDRWVNIEKLDIEKTKVTLFQEWDKTVKMIEETQKSVDQIKSRINIQSQQSNIGASSSITSGQKQLHSSISGSASKKPSILIEDPPKSFRSGHQDQFLQIDKNNAALSSHRSATYGGTAENLIQYMEKRLGTQHESLGSNRMQDKAESERLYKASKLVSEDELEQLSRLRGESQDENISECSQQPSAEFLERLEKVKNNLDNQYQGHMSITGFDENEIDDVIDQVHSHRMNDLYTEPLIVQENEFSEKVSIEHSLNNFKDESTEQKQENVKIAQMLMQQREDENTDNNDMPQYYDPYLKTEPNFLNEPAIISSDSSASAQYSIGHSNVHSNANSNANSKEKEEPTITFVNVKTRPEFNLTAVMSDEHKKSDLVDKLTDALFESLKKECMQIPEPRKSLEKKEIEDEHNKDQQADVYRVDSQLREKEERKEWIEIRQRHLIENDLIRIDQYINEIVDSLLQFEIDMSSSDNSQKSKKDAENYHIQFLKQLTQPIQKEPIEVLQALQTSEIGSYKHFETTQDTQKFPIIPVDLYLEIEKAREEAMILRKGSNVSRETQLVWESIHIQNKSFFDAVNESLMKFRPYGLTGEPMPWSNKVRRLQTKVDINSVDTERLFQMVKQEVFRWGQTYCGCLPSPVFAFPSHSQKQRNQDEFNNELFQEFREKRQTQVLWAETVEQEHHWLNFEYEEAQVKIDLSDMILEHLVDELVQIMNEKNQSQLN